MTDVMEQLSLHQSGTVPCPSATTRWSPSIPPVPSGSGARRLQPTQLTEGA
eukprot:gene5902-2307_t